MSSILWNYWRFGNPCIVNTLQKIVLEEDPTLVFLIETIGDDKYQKEIGATARFGGAVCMTWWQFGAPMEKFYESVCSDILTPPY